jgi:hypothetical protein
MMMHIGKVDKEVIVKKISARRRAGRELGDCRAQLRKRESMVKSIFLLREELILETCGFRFCKGVYMRKGE